MNVEVIDTFDADTIEVGDLISLTAGTELDEVTVHTKEDTGDQIHITGYSEVHGDVVEYYLAPSKIVHLLGTVAEEID